MPNRKPPNAGEKLTARERLYVQHRAGGLNQSRALIAAGYKGKRPDVAASKIEAKPAVSAAIEAAIAASLSKIEVTQEQWMREAWDIASTKVAKKQIRPSDKNKALELVGRAIGAFKDTAGEREVIGPGLTIVIQQNSKSPTAANSVPLAPGVQLMPRPER